MARYLIRKIVVLNGRNNAICPHMVVIIGAEQVMEVVPGMDQFANRVYATDCWEKLRNFKGSQTEHKLMRRFANAYSELSAKAGEINCLRTQAQTRAFLELDNFFNVVDL